ncbi:MAG TPA: hypothetical protein VEU50_17165, partial [Archangium sp.]|nr:hypothetical protein [Archangium sp.]
MHPRLIHILYVVLLVPLVVQAAPPEVEARLSVLEPVEVSGHQGDEGQGLKLTFKALGPNPALALFTLEDARAVVAALEAELQEAEPRAGRSVVEKPDPGVVMGLLGVMPPDARPSTLERRVR